MIDASTEKFLGKLLYIGSPIVTVFILTSVVTDPVNVTKLFIGSGVAFAILCLLIFKFPKQFWIENKWLVGITLAFILAMFNSLFQSESPWSQNLYGAYGRNTGLLTYLILCIFLIGGLGVRSMLSFDRIVSGILWAGGINIIYCAWVLAFGDFVGWENPYGKILGLFGNPDFISAYLGIFISVALARIFQPKSSNFIKVLLGIASLVALFEIRKSHAIQGLAVTAAGAVIVIFFVVRARFVSIRWTGIYVAIVSSLGLLSVLGAFQIGPLTKFIYKTSVSLRGVYWDAGLQMGFSHPLSGVGMDSYGDWYRYARSASAATTFPGPTTTSNVAHNVIIDFFAFGGWPLLLTYLAILACGISALVRLTSRTNSSDGTAVALIAAWSCYQLQSVISINQMGLAIWGWLLTGVLVAYERITRVSPVQADSLSNEKSKRKSNSSNGIITPQLVGGIGFVVGLMIAFPPLNADMKLKAAFNSRQVTQVDQALAPSLMNPSDSFKFLAAINTFANSNLQEKAHEYALKAAVFNPRSFDAWRAIYLLPNSTPAEKDKALGKLKELDPNNPNVTQ